MTAKFQAGRNALLQHFFRMLFYALKRFVADIVLEFARVLGGGLFVNPERHEHLSQKNVAFVDVRGDFYSLVGQNDVAVSLNAQKPLFLKLLYNDAYGRLRITHFRGNVHRADIAFFEL